MLLENVDSRGTFSAGFSLDPLNAWFETAELRIDTGELSVDIERDMEHVFRWVDGG